MNDRRWELFVDSLKALACEPSVQLARFPDFVAKVDELAEEFYHWYRVARGLGKFTPGQTSMLDAIDSRLGAISGQANARFWTEEALSNEPVWEDIRKMATEALRSLGEEPGPPGPNTNVYVGGG